MTSSRIRAEKVGLSSTSSTICVQPANTSGALANSRNTASAPPRSTNSGAAFRVCSGVINATRDMLRSSYR